MSPTLPIVCCVGRIYMVLYQHMHVWLVGRIQIVLHQLARLADRIYMVLYQLVWLAGTIWTILCQLVILVCSLVLYQPGWFVGRIIIVQYEGVWLAGRRWIAPEQPFKVAVRIWLVLYHSLCLRGESVVYQNPRTSLWGFDIKLPWFRDGCVSGVMTSLAFDQITTTLTMHVFVCG